MANRKQLEIEAEELGIDTTGFETNKQFSEAINAKKAENGETPQEPKKSSKNLEELDLTVNEVSREGDGFVLQVSGEVRVHNPSNERRNELQNTVVGSKFQPK